MVIFRVWIKLFLFALFLLSPLSILSPSLLAMICLMICSGFLSVLVTWKLFKPLEKIENASVQTSDHGRLEIYLAGLKNECPHPEAWKNSEWVIIADVNPWIRIEPKGTSGFHGYVSQGFFLFKNQNQRRIEFLKEWNKTLNERMMRRLGENLERMTQSFSWMPRLLMDPLERWLKVS